MVVQSERVREHGALAELAAVLQLAAAGRLRCSEKTRRPSAATVRAVGEVLDGGDFYEDEPVRAFAWPLLLQAGALAGLSGGRLELTARGHRALAAPAHETARDLWRRWLGHGVLDEFSRIEEIKGQRAANVLSAAGPRRKAVGAALAGCCPPGEWVTVDALFEAMRAAGLDPCPVRSGQGLWKLYLEDAQYGSLGYDGHHDWPVLQGRYTLCVLFEYAAALGLIDVRYTHPDGAREDFRHMWGADWLGRLSRYDGLHALRLNPLGAYATGHTGTYEPGPAPAAGERGAVRVLANCDVVALDGLAPAGALLLEAFAARTADRVWTLSLASLLKALHAGRDLAELRGFLADSSAGQELPQPAAVLLDDAALRTGKVRDLGARHVLECADEAQAVTITRDRRAGALCSRIGPRHLTVSPGELPALRTARSGSAASCRCGRERSSRPGCGLRGVGACPQGGEGDGGMAAVAVGEEAEGFAGAQPLPQEMAGIPPAPGCCRRHG
ncbi:helicase-associated domain-containing protein [Streptomyces olivoreticuli]|uniref:helicase-associated domain-containing protein n=1 Tax=Streptomyces olivoreticuli TaxID=68246 RepID=UPI00265A4C58|nr:helicase-associated domain-containing protein [Streptomyces olivoreticuli]WKK27312.1 helicase-associated domain-containing protein [Streptomyces olivoreticuli]